MPATLYLDKKKNLFLEKEVLSKTILSQLIAIFGCKASLVVSLINNRGSKIVGVTKIDLAAYPNLNIKGKDLSSEKWGFILSTSTARKKGLSPNHQSNG